VAPMASEAEDRNGHIRVLIAEDEPTVREALGELIDGETALRLVGSAGDAEEAIRLAREHRPDVALLDVKMPAGGGPRAAREIRAQCPDTRVVALSAYEDRATVLEMLRAGASGYLVKGTPAVEIVDAIRRSTRGQASLSAEVTADVIHELVELLDRSERMARNLRDLDRVKSEMIQLLSHELLTPVTVIQGTTRTLADLRDSLSADDVRGLAEGMGRATSRIKRLVANLTATARLDREDVEIATQPMAVGDIIQRSLLELTGPQSRLRLPERRSARLRLWADPHLAPLALTTILENALALSPAESEIEVEAREGEDVEIRVADRGPGVPEEVRERIFQAFTQADPGTTRHHEGLGISLYLASKIMAAHGGRIGVEGRPGGGSVFTLSFPAVQDSTAA
jgi:signal transduction histidine kinase